MNKKKWAVLIICITLAFGYIKLFYKTYSNSAVIQSADCIVAIDVKRITNTLIWNFITTPSQWKPGNIFKRSTGTDAISWRDMVKIPDYILAFHVNNQPATTWYITLAIKDEKDFAKGLQQYHFVKLNMNFTQDFYYETKDKTKNTLRLTVDIFNVGNLINKQWGVTKTFTRTNPLNYVGVGADGKPTFSFPYLDANNQTPLTQSYRDNLGIDSRWQMQIGVRYLFN